MFKNSKGIACCRMLFSGPWHKGVDFIAAELISKGKKTEYKAFFGLMIYVMVRLAAYVYLTNLSAGIELKIQGFPILKQWAITFWAAEISNSCFLIAMSFNP